MRDNGENRLEDVAREAIERGTARKITIVWNSGVTTKLKAPGHDQPPPNPNSGLKLKDIHRALLSVMTPEQQTAKAIAHRAGYRSLQRVYSALRDLVDAGRIAHTPEGFCLPRSTNGEQARE